MNHRHDDDDDDRFESLTMHYNMYRSRWMGSRSVYIDIIIIIIITIRIGIEDKDFR